jgi:RNA polymerase sigma factor (sigma-70 family)
MKTDTYKRIDGKVEKLNDFNNLENSHEAVLMAEYQDLFDKITNGSKVVNFIKTREFKDSLQDVLQEVTTKVLQDGKFLEIPISEIKIFLKGCFIKKVISRLDSETRYNIFKRDNLDLIIEDKESGITQEYISECLIAIKNLLSESQYKLFSLYHIKGYTMEEIALQLSTNKMEISRKIKSISIKIEDLKISYLYENRYLAYTSHKKKRQHKRKVLSRKEIIELSGMPYQMSIEVYQESKEVKEVKEVIPFNKCMSYPTKQYYKVTGEDKNQIADMGSNCKKDFYLISNLVLGNCKLLPLTSKEVNEKEVIEM